LRKIYPILRWSNAFASTKDIEAIAFNISISNTENHFGPLRKIYPILRWSNAFASTKDIEAIAFNISISNAENNFCRIKFELRFLSCYTDALPKKASGQ